MQVQDRRRRETGGPSLSSRFFSMKQLHWPIRYSRDLLPRQKERKNDGWLVSLHPRIIHRRSRRRQATGPYLLRPGSGWMVYPPAAGIKKEKAEYLTDRQGTDSSPPQESHSFRSGTGSFPPIPRTGYLPACAFSCLPLPVKERQPPIRGRERGLHRDQPSILCPAPGIRGRFSARPSGVAPGAPGNPRGETSGEDFCRKEEPGRTGGDQREGGRRKDPPGGRRQSGRF